jgi:DNA-binding MarR family transcriptional regulator
MADAVDDLLAQWAQQRPDLDPSPMGVIGRLSRAARLVEARLRPVFAAHDLDPASFDVLATLRRHDLTRAAMVTSGAITQRLDRLEARGLVGRAPRAGDGRGVVVALTPQGRALIDRALPDHVANEHRILAGLDAGERAALAAALRGLLLALGDTGRGRDAGDGQVGQVGRAG